MSDRDSKHPPSQPPVYSRRPPSPSASLNSHHASSSSSSATSAYPADDKGSSSSKIDFFRIDGKGLSSSARPDKNGRITVDFKLKAKLPDLPPDYARDTEEVDVEEERRGAAGRAQFDVPVLDILMTIVGSRGPFWSSQRD